MRRFYEVGEDKKKKIANKLKSKITHQKILHNYNDASSIYRYDANQYQNSENI